MEFRSTFGGIAMCVGAFGWCLVALKGAFGWCFLGFLGYPVAFSWMIGCSYLDNLGWRLLDISLVFRGYGVALFVGDIVGVMRCYTRPGSLLAVRGQT